MAYSETRIVIGGLAHVPILIFIVNLIKDKFETKAEKVFEVEKEEPKVKIVEIKEEGEKAEDVKEEEVKEEEVKEEEVKEEEI